MRPPHLAPLLAIAALSAAFSLAAVMSAAADDGPVEITAAPSLTWGFKQSWRSYAGTPVASAGASVVADPGGAPYQLAWEFESGSYDEATGTTVLRYEGTARWLKYPASETSIAPPPGYGGPLDIHVLDVTMSDPVVTISADEATVSVDAQSRQLGSWQMADLGRVPVVSLDVADVEPVVADGTTTWTGIPAASAGSSNEVFAGNYPAGRAVDAVGFSYDGPGGAPDLTEHWDAPGSAKLALAQNRIVTENGLGTQYSAWWLDRQRRIVHYRSSAIVDGLPVWTYRALSLDTLQEIGEPLVLPNAENIGQPTLFDASSGRLFYRRVVESQTSRWIRFDAEQGYVLGTLAEPIPIVGNQSLMWDSVGQRAFNVRRLVPDGVAGTAYDEHQWQLTTYTEQQDRSWAAKAYDLPNFPTGLNSVGYATATTVNAPAGVAAPDGSLVLLGDRQTSSVAGVTPPATVPGAYRVVFNGGGETVTVNAVPGSGVPNNALNVFKTLQAGPAGQVTLMRAASGSAPVVQNVTVAAGAATSTPPVSLTGLDTNNTTDFAVDPEDGTAWVGGWQSQRIVGVHGGRVVSNQFFKERHPRGGPLLAGPGHILYSQTNDGSTAGVGGSPIYGFGRFDRLGFSPTVTQQPAAAAASLGVAEGSEAVTFTSTGTGDPAPARRWQVKKPGTSRFADVAGATGATLTVDAVRGLGGAQYRAVYSNPAGAIASDPATLTVAYAPRIAVDVSDVSVTAGADAAFQVLPEGDPDPDITWQRRVGGFWQDVAPDDDNFEIDGGTLTVRDTNLEQSGALFRARLSNAVATVYTKAGELTVDKPAGIPAEGLSLSGVTLAWTGSAEFRKAPPVGGANYFSAGASDGTEATYAATAGDVGIRQVSPSGQETTASWLTRAGHVLGGGEQLVRLAGGDAEIEADGSAVVDWSGAFSINFYGGMVPFTIADPRLVVDGDGTGTLTADLSGYASSQQNPGQRTPLAPVDDVTVATFSGMEVDPDGAVTVDPDYDGVEVTVPAGTTPQARTPTGWGAWPQPLVDFHVQTGLSSYWYSSGGSADPYKQPDPFVVDFSGAGHAAEPPPAGPGTPTPTVASSATTLALDRDRLPYGARTSATVKVATSGRPAAGSVTVRAAGKAVTAPLADGAATLTLPGGAKPGRHQITATYGGAPQVSISSASAAVVVDKARPRLSARVAKQSIGRSRRGVVRVAATFAGNPDVHPTGQLVIRDGGRIVRIGVLRRADKGRARIVLPRLLRGTHYLRVSLSGSPLQHATSTAYRVLRIE